MWPLGDVLVRHVLSPSELTDPLTSRFMAGEYLTSPWANH